MSDPKKKVRRLPPCPDYDVEGMESWLTDLAREDGLFLVRDSFFAGAAEFERGEPRQDVKYRLEAAAKSTSMWADGGGEPDPEAVELNRAYSWEYMGKRGNFYIYRTDDPAARELNTDPEVQAMTIRAVRKRQAGSVFYLLFWLALYPLLYLSGRGGLLQAVVELGTWFFLWTAAMALWALIDGAAELIFLSRLIKKLKSGGTLEQKKPWRDRLVPYQLKRFAQIALLAAWIITGMCLWAYDVGQQHPASAYRGTPPFATLSDFAAAGMLEYRENLYNFDEVEEWSDWLAPRNLRWEEHGGFFTGPGSSEATCGLYVDYHRMAAPFLARWMAWDLARYHGSGPYYRQLELPPLDVDYAAAFTDVFPTVVLQKGNEVVRVTFYQNPADILELADWASVMADSLDG